MTKTNETADFTLIHAEYDDAGKVISEKYKNGNSTIEYFYYYDDAGNVISTKLKSGNSTIQLFYDKNGKEIRRTIEHFDKNGNCIGLYDYNKESGEYKRYTSFDSKGRKTERTVIFNDKTDYYWYRKDGTLKTEVSEDSAGTRILFKYNKNGSLKNKRVLRGTAEKEKPSVFSIENMIKTLWFYTIIGFLWQRIDILEFGQAQPAFSDSIFGFVLAIAITMALHFYKLSKANKTNNVVNINIVNNGENTK